MLVGFSTFAQPSFTEQQLTPVVGEQITFVNFEGGNAGSGGNNKTWTFNAGNLNIYDTATVKIIAPSKTPFANKFTSANIAFSYDSAEFDFYQTGTTYRKMGMGYFDPPNNESVVYSDAKDELRFPLNTNTNFSDTYFAQSSQSGFTSKEAGRLHTIADGWGSITTPAGTFANVLRVVTTDSATYIFSGFGNSDTTRVVTKSYKWYAAGIHFPVLQIDSVREDGGIPDVTGKFYAGAVVSSIHKAIDNNISIYPNPVSQWLQIKAPENTVATIAITDLAGREVMRQSISETQINLSLASLEKGVYIIQLFNHEQLKIAEQKIVKQ